MWLKSYISHAVHHGVLIIDRGVEIPRYECQNYNSAMSEPAFSFLNELVHKELLQQRLIMSQTKPHCVHAIGGVPKSGGGWRPITDCCRPLGKSINNYMDSTFKEFSRLILHGCHMATVDIEAAYRTVTVAPEQWMYQGLAWPVNGRHSYLLDTSLCFGLRCAPYVFNHFGNFVARCLQRRGYTAIINYLDNYWIRGRTFDECQVIQMKLIEILGSLGFLVSFKKCTSPSTRVVYLGIEFDSVAMTIALPSHKLEKLIQRLCGIISHAAKVIKGARTFTRRMIDLLKIMPHTRRRVRLSMEFLNDLAWWESVASRFNGVALLIARNDGMGPHFTTNASQNGYGYVYGNTWKAGFYNNSDQPEGHRILCKEHHHWTNIHLNIVKPHIIILELIPVWLCVKTHAREWANQHIVCFSDNSQVIYMLNKGTSLSPLAMVFIRSIFWYSAIFNFHITGRYIRGIDNVVVDCLSRVYAKGLHVLRPLNLCCFRNEAFDEGASITTGYMSFHYNSIGLGTVNASHPQFTVVEISGLLLGQRVKTTTSFRNYGGPVFCTICHRLVPLSQ